MLLARKDAPGRLAGRAPVAIVDIGSNSVRLVAYEGLSRSPTPIFNDKVLCGLGRGVATTGRLPQDGVDRALAALRRFRVLCAAMEISDIHVIRMLNVKHRTLHVIDISCITAIWTEVNYVLLIEIRINFII